MRTQTASITLAAANAASVAASQAPSGAGALTLTASPVVLDVARRVIVTTTGADAGKTVALTGTDRNNNAIYEVLTLVNAGVAQSIQDFKTVSAATISAAASALTVGTNGVASTRWIALDHTPTPSNLGVQVNFGTAAANVVVEVTLDEPNRAYVESTPQGSGNMATGVGAVWQVPVPFSVTGLTGISTDALTEYLTPVRAIRLTVNSGALTAGTRITVLQTGRA